MITKACPNCNRQVAVACKTCTVCGHSFSRKLGAPETNTDEGSVHCRRTERVKRVKPNYYDSLEYDKQMKKLHQTRHRSSAEEHLDDEESPSKKKKRKRKKKKVKQQEREEEEDDDLMANFSPEKGKKCEIILSEINRKICSTSWRV